MKGEKGKTPAIISYDDFKDHCAENRKWALNLIENITRYTPFVFKAEENEKFDIYAGFRIISDLTKLLNPRRTSEYKAWRSAVLNKDNYTCQICDGQQNLHVHHIIPVVESLKLSMDVENGITLCAECHRRSHSNE